jgi:hypothetical protein
MLEQAFQWAFTFALAVTGFAGKNRFWKPN